MATKLERFTYLPWGGNLLGAPLGVEQFGSAAAGNPVYTTTPSVIQGLAAWLNGWPAALVSAALVIPPYVPTWNVAKTYFSGEVVQSAGVLYSSLVNNNTGNTPATSPASWQSVALGSASKLPFIEDANAVDFVHGQGLAYIYEMGIAEWDSGTTYFTNSYVQLGGLIYRSLIDSNLNNSPSTSPLDWILWTPGTSWWGGNLGGESTTTQLNLTIPGFPPNSQIPTGTTVTCFVGVAFGTFFTGGCTVAINGGTPIVINDYNHTSISASVTVTLAKYFTLLFNGVTWSLVANYQNDGVLAPSVTGTQNNYNPTGFGPAVTVLKLGTTGVTTITGLTTGLSMPNGWEIQVVNSGSANATLSNLSGSSSVGNRIAVYNGADYVLAPGNFCKIRYSVQDQEWLLHP